MLIYKDVSVFVLVFLIFSSSCGSDKVEGVLIGDTLYTHSDFQEISELKFHVVNSLKGNEQSFKLIKDFECGGGAGCYDLGFVLTQIIYKIGEDKAIEMIQRLDGKERKGFLSLIKAGLEYGDNDRNGQSDDKLIENEFPSINKLLRSQPS